MIGGQFTPEGDGGFNQKRTAAIDGGLTRLRSVKLRLYPFEQSGLKLPYPDRGQTIHRRRGELGFLKFFIELLGLFRRQVTAFGPLVDPDFFAEFVSLRRDDPAELLLKKVIYRSGFIDRLVVLQHLQQNAQFNPLGVRLDFLGFRR